ncbi:hypothetical protein C8A00DRAFT_43359 [Chaetomidium leptoderma]|uniref:Uncharacterized protein n=1 Tax=Chaetomidium leptoderma TaxID=669021 RepID=A0AAN6VM00_9PEZI|nr:hypothetical protein C8A00DRAFT_43359 [Chaetomidium leptoderma]
MASKRKILGVPFIVATSLAKPDAKTRKLIRSHVMRGKNVGKFRDSKHWAGSKVPPHPSDHEASGRSTSGPRVPEEVTRDEGWALVTPRKVASELALFGFGGDMQPYALELIYRAFTVVKPATYGLQGIAVDGSQDDKLFCFANLTHRPGILHSTLFAAQAFHDLTRGLPFGAVARLHLAKAFNHLQKSLDDKREAVELSTMAVVVSLAMAAVITGDLETAAKHMDGLQKIVELRGGSQSWRSSSMIIHKASAIDLGLAMSLGHKLRFARECDLSAALQLHQRPDPRLLNVWADIREFSKLANKSTTVHGTTMPREVVSRLATSVPHRLLRLRPEGAQAFRHRKACLHELLRLCMLAYAKMLLIKLQGLGMAERDSGPDGLCAWVAVVGRDEGGAQGVLVDRHCF